MIEDKEFRKRMKELPFRRRINYDELAYARSDSGKVYSFCPLCRKIVVLPGDQVETESMDRAGLKKTVSCDCRSGIRTLDKRFLREDDENDVSVWPSVFICAGVFLVAWIVLEAIMGLPEDYSRRWDGPVAICMLIMMVIALIGFVASFFHPVTLLFRKETGNPKEYYEDVIHDINKMIHDCQIEKRVKRESAEAKAKQEDQGVKRTGTGYAKAGATGHAAVSSLDEDEPAFGLSDSYVPDDYEPDLDPYDRQALYDEEVVDDWVIAGGGDPFDFDDRMDALSDPFGFGGDGDSWND